MATMLSPPGLFSITTGWPHFWRELLGEQPPADVGAGARAERHDELHRPGRPALRLCGCNGGECHAQHGDGGGNQAFR